MTTIEYCHRCSYRLWEYGYPAIEFYREACLHASQNRIFDRTDHNETAIFLEHKGFILTTEVDKYTIRIKPLGHIHKADNTHRFCLCNE